MAVLLLSFQAANALIVSVNGEAIPAEGTTVTITEAELDPLTEQLQMGLEGSLLASGKLTVTITRSEANLSDEFCCADLCKSGNGSTSETFEYTLDGDKPAKWFAHYAPAGSSDVTIEYLFSDGTESRKLTARFVYQPEAIENIQAQPDTKAVYSLSGTLLNAEGDMQALPDGMYIQNGQKIIKSTH